MREIAKEKIIKNNKYKKAMSPKLYVHLSMSVNNILIKKIFLDSMSKMAINIYKNICKNSENNVFNKFGPYFRVLKRRLVLKRLLKTFKIPFHSGFRPIVPVLCGNGSETEIGNRYRTETTGLTRCDQ